MPREEPVITATLALRSNIAIPFPSDPPRLRAGCSNCAGSAARCVLREHDPGGRRVVHLVRAVAEAQGANARQALRQLEVLAAAGAAMGLNGVVDDPERHVR